MADAPSPEMDPAMHGPPEDPESWSDDQWIAWLRDTDPGEAATGSRLAAWRSHPVGSVLGAAMLGLRDAIYGKPDEAAVVADVPGEPPGDGDFDLHLDHDHPERSEVVVRRSPPEEP